VSVPRMYFNLFFVFLVSGFWHGANWTFIVWGALHGFYLIFALFTKNARKKVNDTLGISKRHSLNNTLDVVITFVLVVIGWVFFRANNVRDGFYIIKKMCGIPKEIMRVLSTRKIAFLNLPGLINILVPCFGLIIFLEVAHIVQIKYKLEHTFSSKPKYVRWMLYYGGILAILFLGVFDEQKFIYFQF